jgi:hypothetical protein
LLKPYWLDWRHDMGEVVAFRAKRLSGFVLDGPALPALRINLAEPITADKFREWGPGQGLELRVDGVVIGRMTALSFGSDTAPAEYNPPESDPA